MATIGNIVIGISARTDQLGKDLARASADLSRFQGRALDAASSIDAFGARAANVASRVETASIVLGRFSGAAAVVTKGTQAMGPALAVVSGQIREFAIVAETASIVARVLSGAVTTVAAALRVVAAPFVAVGRGIAYLAKNFGLLAVLLSTAMTPLRPFIAAMGAFNVVANTAGGAVRVLGFGFKALGIVLLPIGIAIKGVSLAFRALHAVLTLNVRTLAVTTAKLAALVVSTAAAVAVKSATFAFNVLRTSLVGVAKAAGPVTLALALLARSSAGAIDSAGDTADRIGTTTANLMSLRYAAQLTGSNVESLDNALAKMVPNLGEAAAKGGPVADALGSVGLSAAQLTTMDSADAFGVIADRLSKVENPAQRAALAMDIFGKSGAGILGTINAGGAEIQRLAGEYRSFGAVSEAQRQQIGAMYDAFDRIGTLFSAVGGRLAAELAPYITAAAEYFVGLAKSGLGAGEVVSSGVKMMLEAIAVGLDIVDSLRLAFFFAQRGITQAVAWIVEAALKASRAFDAMWGALTGDGGASSATTTLAAVADELRKTVEGQTADIGAKMAKTSYGDQARAVFADIARSAELARAKIDETPKAFAAIEASADKMDKATSKAFDSMKSDAERYTEAAMTPLEKFEAEQAKLKKLFDAGLITQQTLDRVTAKGQADLAGEGAKTSPRAAALEVGSEQARTALLAFRDQSRPTDATPQKATAANTSRSVDIQTASLGVLQAIARTLATPPAAEVL